MSRTTRRRLLLGGTEQRFDDASFGTMLGWFDFSDLSTLLRESGNGAAPTAVTSSGDPVGRVLNKISGGPFFYSPTDSARPTRVAYANAYGARTDGVDDYYVTSDTNYWKPLSDGTGCSVYCRFRIPTANPATSRRILDNSNDSSINTGITISHRGDSVLNTLEASWSRSAVGAQCVSGNSALNTVPTSNADVLLCVRMQRVSGTNTLVAHCNNSEILRITGTNAPNNANPTYPLTYARSANAAGGFLTADTRYLLIYSGFHNDAQRAEISAMMLQ